MTSPPPRSPDSAPDAPPTVLVVDDEPTLRTVLRRALAREGWAVEEAADGLEGLERLRADGDRYAVVFLDLSLPGLPGRQLWERVRAERPELLDRLVIVSGAEEDWVTEAGCTQLGKPFDLVEARRVAREVARRAGRTPPTAAG